MDAIKLLTDDHRSFRALLTRYQAAQTQQLREDLAGRLVHEIRLHIRLEEKYVYPIAIERSGVRLDEHEAARRSLAGLEKVEAFDRRYGPMLTEAVEDVLRHSDEEEKHFFPALRKTMGRAELEALGRLIQNAREERPAEPPPALVARAVTHVLTAWKLQLGSALERACFAALRINSPAQRTSQS